jgi:multicomponent Na+:H+ antiporter subunit D
MNTNPSVSAALMAAPVLVPLVTAVLTTLAGPRPRLQMGLSIAGLLVLLDCALALLLKAAAGEPLVTSFGNWTAPLGIEFAIDRTSALMILVTAVLGGACLLFLAGETDGAARHPLLLPLIHGLLAGVGGAFATADLFNLYVWFEVMLICTLGLFVLGTGREALEACFKYLGLNLFGTLLLLMAVGLIYGISGHLNFGALSASPVVWTNGLGAVLLSLLTLAFLVKAGAFPFFAWLPASYHTLPTPVLALIAGLLTKVGVYALLRTLGDVFAAPPAWLFEALGWVAVATMVTGVLGAAYHWDMRRILAFHIISQIGYILLAVALATPEAHAAALFYTVHHIIVKANLFLIAGLVWRSTGRWDLRLAGGLYALRPALAVLFLIPALSLVGIPPLSGFWAKFVVLEQAVAAGRTAWVAAALAVSVLTLYSMMKIWLEAFWKDAPPPTGPALPPAGTARALPWAGLCATWGLALITLAIGLAPEPLAAYARQATAHFGELLP